MALDVILFSQLTIASGRELNLSYAQTLYLTVLSFNKNGVLEGRSDFDKKFTKMER